MGLLGPWAGGERGAPGEVGQGHQGPLVPSGHTILGGLNGFCCFDFGLKTLKAEEIMLKLF